MPEMNGLQMIAALNSQFPDLEVSVLTGYREAGEFFARVQKTGWGIGERIPQSGAWKIDQKVL